MCSVLYPPWQWWIFFTGNHFIALKISMWFTLMVPLPENPGNYWSVWCLSNFPFAQCHVIGIIQSAGLSDCLLPLGNIHLKCIRVFMCPKHILFFFFWSEVRIPLYWYDTVCVHLPVWGNYEYSYYTHLYASFCVHVSFQISCINTNTILGMQERLCSVS